MTSRKIVGLKSDYGSLDLGIENRAAFIEDAQRVLREVGEALKARGLISEEFMVRHLSSSTPGYAGEIVAGYVDPQRRFAVNLVYAHTPQQVNTRPDGVGGYALYRRTRPHPKGDTYDAIIDSGIRPGDRRPLYGSYPDALIHLVQTMLAEHPLNPDAPRNPQATS